MGIQNVIILSDKVIKTFKSNITYNRELMIYKHKLSYTPKLIEYDNLLKQIIIEKINGLSFVKIPIKIRDKYYIKARELYYKFYNDTGYYLYDYHPGNIILNELNQLILIDFEFIGKEKKIKHRKGIESFLNKINVNQNLNQN
jgi:thiamine kinase-like enzyme